MVVSRQEHQLPLGRSTHPHRHHPPSKRSLLSIGTTILNKAKFNHPPKSISLTAMIATPNNARLSPKSITFHYHLPNNNSSRHPNHHHQQTSDHYHK